MPPRTRIRWKRTRVSPRSAVLLPPRVASLPQECRLEESISEQITARWRIFPVSLRNAFDFASFSRGSAEKRHSTDRTWHQGSVPTSVAVRTVLPLMPAETLFKALKAVLSPFFSCLPFGCMRRFPLATGNGIGYAVPVRRKFHLAFRTSQAVPDFLGWSHCLAPHGGEYGIIAFSRRKQAWLHCQCSLD